MRNRVSWRAYLSLAVVATPLLAACDTARPTAYSSAPESPAFAKGTAPGKPIRSPLPNVPFTVPAGGACSFALAVTIVSSNEVTTVFPPEPNGDVVEHINGTLILGLTNGSTNKSIQANVSGPGTLVFHPDGSITETTEGRSLFIFNPASIPAGPMTFIYSGLTVANITPSGQLILVSQSGNVMDVCAALS